MALLAEMQFGEGIVPRPSRSFKAPGWLRAAAPRPIRWRGPVSWSSWRRPCRNHGSKIRRRDVAEFGFTAKQQAYMRANPIAIACRKRNAAANRICWD